VSAKKKGGHGGLKFLAVLLVVGAVVAGVHMTRNTELMQRVFGHREDHRLDRTALTPRFAFASAQLKVTVGSIYNDHGTPLDITSTSDLLIDRQSQTAKMDTRLERTPTTLEPGVEAVPFDASKAEFTEILTTDKVYESPDDPTMPWTEYPTGPGVYGTAVDEHYVPMIDDVMGFELRQLATETTPPAAASSLRSSLVTRAVGASTPSDVVTSYTFIIDLETYRRAAPILAGRTHLDGAPETEVTLTIGFDDTGLLRFVEVSIPSTVATDLVNATGDGTNASYHYVMSVDVISGEPLVIEVPTDVVDSLGS
jgi:hypothetical protein